MARSGAHFGQLLPANDSRGDARAALCACSRQTVSSWVLAAVAQIQREWHSCKYSYSKWIRVHVVMRNPEKRKLERGGQSD
jgi:hypothetical protein